MARSSRSYSVLATLPTFEERFRYLALSGVVGERTFGSERWLNQSFYNSAEWRSIRNVVIARDNGCDLGIDGRDIHSSIYIHHMNPMTPRDLHEARAEILDPEFLISVTLRTHNAIHYGDERQLYREPVERRPGDTIPWRRNHG